MKTAGDRAWPVGQLRPNDRGLFDSLGNALEWVEDRASLYNVSRLEDIESKSYLKLDARENRVLRGGSFDSTPAAQRGALRGNERPGNRSDAMGVRPARTLP
mgnify:CR=1 FL=1